ncbi:cytidylyltransferase domain-containing protein [Singulisphaera sp. PoT]|uniref:cytidylyltransferase domain-containing protein n=1 Tax=Singulisphaera sp. PoT TaxID=3411797 RepID=UPI003BF4F8B4
MKVVAIVQARLGSTRLPRKVLQDLDGEPMLARVLNRLQRARLVDQVVVATTTEARDSPLVEWCESSGWPVFQGSETDVLDRYLGAAKAFNADVVVRITSDCPLIDPGVVDLVVKALLIRQPPLDYVSNILTRTYPRGLDTEAFRHAALESAWIEDQDVSSREHVTPYLYRKPGRFRLGGVENEKDVSHLRWTVDTAEDLELIRRIYETFGHDEMSWREVLDLIERNPEWSEINRHIEQKVI